MIIREQALEIVNNSIPILFNTNRDSISALRKSLLDAETSLLSELSSYNNFLLKAIEFNKKLIIKEYIEYLISEIIEMNSKTINFDSLKNLSISAKSMRDISKNFSDGEIKERINLVENKISQITRYDISKSSKLNPIIRGKISDFIDSLDSRIDEINNENLFISKRIIDCESLIESCDFCKYIFSSKLSDSGGYICLLEEKYEVIVKELLGKYYEWKGEPTCPYL